MKNSITSLCALFILLGSPVFAWAQASNYSLDEASTIVVKGTSTLHDWEADAEKIQDAISLDSASIQRGDWASLVKIFSVTIPVESLESGKGKMNRKMQDALKMDDHPNILFSFKSAQLVDNGQDGQSFTLQVTGNLKISGSLKEITFPVTVTRENNDGLRFEGTYTLNMKAYDVDPPSAMLGTIRTGEEVEIVFNLLASKGAR